MNLAIFSFVPAFGTQTNISDSNVQVTLNYPDIVKQGDNFVLSSVVKATADQVSNITITIASPEGDCNIVLSILPFKFYTVDCLKQFLHTNAFECKNHFWHNARKGVV